jgi:hypothetical protein
LARAEAASVLRFITTNFVHIGPGGPAERRYSPNFRSYLSVPIKTIVA